LLELVFVMVIIAVAAAIAIPTIGAGRRQREVRTTLQRLVSAVRTASSTSIFQRRRVELRVWPDDGEYGIVEPASDRLDEEFDDDRRGVRLGGRLGDEDDDDGANVERVRLPESARFGDIEGGRRGDLDNTGTISFDFFPTGSSSGGEIELIFENDRNRQTYLLKINPLVSSISMEADQ